MSVVRVYSLLLQAGLVLTAPVAALLSARIVDGRVGPERPPTAHAQAAMEVDSPPLRPTPFLGVVIPRETTDVAPPDIARVVAINVRIGDKIRANDVIATLDSRLLASEVAAARAAANSQRVEHEKAIAASKAATEHAERVQALAREGLASAEDVLNASRELRIAMLQVDSTRAVIAQKDADVRRLAQQKDLWEVRAPFDGTVVARYVDPGAMVSISPLVPLVRIISSDRLFLRFAIPESHVTRLHSGSRVTATADAAGTTIRARIERVAPEIDATTHTAMAEAEIDHVDGEIASGLVVHVTEDDMASASTGHGTVPVRDSRPPDSAIVAR